MAWTRGVKQLTCRACACYPPWSCRPFWPRPPPPTMLPGISTITFWRSAGRQAGAGKPVTIATRINAISVERRISSCTVFGRNMNGAGHRIALRPSVTPRAAKVLRWRMSWVRAGLLGTSGKSMVAARACLRLPIIRRSGMRPDPFRSRRCLMIWPRTSGCPPAWSRRRSSIPTPRLKEMALPSPVGATPCKRYAFA